MRGFLILGTILAALVGWLFWAAPDTQAGPLPVIVMVAN